MFSVVTVKLLVSHLHLVLILFAIYTNLFRTSSDFLMEKLWTSDGGNRNKGLANDISSFSGRFTIVNGSDGNRVRVKYLPGSPDDM